VHRTMLVAALTLGLGTGLAAAVSADGTAPKPKEQTEKEKKAAKKKPKEGKVFTNTDLASPTPKSSASPAATPAPTTSTTSTTGRATAGNIDPDTGRVIGEGANVQPDAQALLPDPQDEGGWRVQAQARRTAIQSAERRVADLEARLAALMADRSPIDVMDPNRLQTIEAEKARARQDLEAAKAELEKARTVWSEFEETARRKGVPPRWLQPPS